jgi:polyribonucleotide nucleotidyltransferase
MKFGPITWRGDVVPRVPRHRVFTRGETQHSWPLHWARQRREVIDGLDEEYRKQFYLHYTPALPWARPASCAAPPPRAGSRRAGGALFARILPGREDFPYTVRIVSEIFESNARRPWHPSAAAPGMMAAGVPIKRPVAALHRPHLEGEEFAVLTDIMGRKTTRRHGLQVAARAKASPACRWTSRSRVSPRDHADCPGQAKVAATSFWTRSRRAARPACGD